MRSTMSNNAHGTLFAQPNRTRGEDNATIASLLSSDLDNYARIVDDPDGVNNYGDEILKKLPKSSAGYQKKWKSSLTAEKILGLLKPLECSKDNSDKREQVNCSNSKINESHVRDFVEARRRYKDNHSVAEVSKNLPSTACGSVSNNLKRKQSDVSSSIQPQSIIPSTFEPAKPSFPKISIFKKPNEKQSKGTHKSVRDIESNEGQPVPQQNPFKTAKDELRVQNVKKYGKETGKDGQYSYGTVKKSLGARKGAGVFGKFQPPIRRNDEEDNGGSQVNGGNSMDDCSEETDERLKNIDPKMIETIRNEIMDSGPKLTWDDIAGLEFAKKTIQEVVVWPMLRPDIFTGLRRPPKGILLFGPPGTGKTLIGKCIASQSGATFLSISASSLTSKWVGDGEKMVRALFAVARVYQPSVVFIDEIDSLLSQRSDTEHESSRRIKTEFLVQLDGVGTGEEDRILIIGATNRPQELDEAARRRLVKRLYIPLPDLNARAQMVNNLIASERHTLSDADVQVVAKMTEGYSGADVKHVCQEASLGPIRSIPPMEIQNINPSQVRPVNIADFNAALVRVKSTVSPDDLTSYVKWDKQFGCGSL